jgi:hypothetical protein
MSLQLKVIPTGTEHLTGQMIEHSLLQTQKPLKTQSTTTLERIQRHRTSIEGKLISFLI